MSKDNVYVDDVVGALLLQDATGMSDIGIPRDRHPDETAEAGSYTERQPTIAWIGGERVHKKPYMQEMADRGVRSVHHEYATPALEDVLKTKYDLIVVEADITSGPDCDDLVMEEVLVGGSERPDYWKVALRVIERVQNAGANQDTPILVTGTHHPKRSDTFPDAEFQCVEEGAKGYVWTANPELDLDRFYDRLEKLAMRRE